MASVAIIAGIFTVLSDYLFHLSLTTPMEVLFYFIAKLLVAIGVAYFLLAKYGALKTAVVFTLLFDLYYGIGVAVLHIPGLSSSPTQVIEINGFGAQCVAYGSCDLVTEGILFVAWTIAHGLFFLAGAIIAPHLSKGLGDAMERRGI